LLLDQVGDRPQQAVGGAAQCEISGGAALRCCGLALRGRRAGACGYVGGQA
jgi:hypothetical protein